jgi:type VI protein secretion system component Hcp
MKKNARTARSSKPAQREAKTIVKDLKPRSGIQGGLSFTKKVDKASPTL